MITKIEDIGDDCECVLKILDVYDNNYQRYENTFIVYKKSDKIIVKHTNGSLKLPLEKWTIEKIKDMQRIYQLITGD